MEQTQTMLGQLRCRVLSPRDKKPESLVLLCHGYGAPGEDLVPLAEACLHVEPSLAHTTRFVFPEAPLSLADMGMPWGRAWWHLNVARLMDRSRGGPAALQAMAQETPEGLGAARRLLRGALEALLTQTGLPYGKVLLGGFSQGAMLACDVALTLEEALGSLVLLSGTLVDRDNWQRRAKNRAGLPVLQSHGTADPILPYDNALALRDVLQGAGLSVDFVSFHGEHQIPQEALIKLAHLAARVARI